MSKKVIITGATSFIGMELINKLLEKDYKVYAIVRSNSDKAGLLPKVDNLVIKKLDMQDYGSLSSIIDEQCDIFFSLAWNGTRGDTRHNYELQKSNYESSMLSVNESLKLGCKYIISAGSQAEYGNINGMINEDSICNPNTEYGKYKLKFYYDAYKLCKDKGIHFKEPRFFSLYGAGDYEGTMIISILRDMLADRECKLTKCIQMWDFLYISDAINGLISLIENNCEDGIYNFGSGDTRELKEFILEMYEITKSKSKLSFGAVPYPSTGMVSIYPSIDKLKNETGWKPEISFQDGIKKIINVLK